MGESLWKEDEAVIHNGGKKMKRWFITAVLLLAVSCGVSQGFSQTRIMPLGDSITEAKADQASYRYWLWHELVNAGYSVDFVGSMDGVRAGSPLYEDFDQNHEGHWGWRADEVLAEIRGWSASAQPEIVLMHLGHNDLFQGQDLASTVDELAGIIVELRSMNAEVAILIALIIPSTSTNLYVIPELNAMIEVMAESVDSPESPVIVVDQWSGFNPENETYDGVHPNEAGEKKMAARWFVALVALSRRIQRSYLPAPRVSGRRLFPGRHR